MPQAKKRATRARSVPRSHRSRTAVATQTVTSTKLAVSTLFLGFAALAAAAAGSLPSPEEQARIDARMAQMMATTTPSTASTTPGVPTKARAQLMVSLSEELLNGSRIITPGSSSTVAVGFWNFTAGGDAIGLRKITFALNTYNGATTNISDFAKFELKSNSNLGKVLSVGFLDQTKNTITFGLPEPLVIAKGKTETLQLRAMVSESGIMEAAAVRAFDIAPDTAANFEALAMSGAQVLTPDQIRIGKGATAIQDKIVQSGPFLIHNVVPAISPFYTGNQLQLDYNAPLNKFNVTANGDRELIIKNLTFSVNVNGLSASGGYVGKISNFRLFEANSMGGLGTQLAVFPLCLSATKNPGCRVSNQETVSFTPTSTVIVSPGTSRTFILVANTVDIVDGKMNGSVTVATAIKGETGFKAGNGAYEKSWADGGLTYTYTPVGSSVKGPYTASDSYTAAQQTLSRSL